MRILLVVIIALLLFSVRADAFPAICDAPYTWGSNYREQLSTDDENLLAEVKAWELTGEEYVNAYGYSIYRLIFETDPAVEDHSYRPFEGENDTRIAMWIYNDRTDEDRVIVFVYTYWRMYGDHDDPDLHNHPDCPSGAMDRENVLALMERMDAYSE